jgi:hypothetical protein
LRRLIEISGNSVSVAALFSISLSVRFYL